MEPIIEFINLHVQYAPFIMFGLLLLAGFCLPVSEDLMLITAGLLAIQNPDKVGVLYVGVYLGAYFSDLICYTLGRKVGPKLFKIGFFAKMVSLEKVESMGNFYKKYGIYTLIFGRFIPFGFRNALFLTAGLSKMNFLRFALSDLLACTISTALLFTLTYNLGESVIQLVKKGNWIIFGVALTFFVIFLIRRNYIKRSC